MCYLLGDVLFVLCFVILGRWVFFAINWLILVGKMTESEVKIEGRWRTLVWIVECSLTVMKMWRMNIISIWMMETNRIIRIIPLITIQGNQATTIWHGLKVTGQLLLRVHCVFQSVMNECVSGYSFDFYFFLLFIS